MVLYTNSLVKTGLIVTWEPLPTAYGLPDDPVENIQQPALAAALTDALGTAGLIQSDLLNTRDFTAMECRASQR